MKTRSNGKLKTTLQLFKDAASNWSSDNAIMMSGSIAYSTIFSIAPLLVIAMAVAGFAFGPQASRGEVFRSMAGLIGVNGARAIESMVRASAQHSSTGLVASIISICLLLIGASSAFSQLQQSLNIIWKVQIKKDHQLWSLIRQRLLTFGMVLVIGFLLLVSLLLTAALSAVAAFVGGKLPGGAVLWQWVNVGVSFTVITALFGAIYKILPDAQLRWRDVWSGAAITAAFFTVGKHLIGLYLGYSSVASSYGAAGSLVVFLLWVYYSSAILLYGAEFTKVWSEHATGREAPPADDAERLAA